MQGGKQQRITFKRRATGFLLPTPSFTEQRCEPNKGNETKTGIGCEISPRKREIMQLIDADGINIDKLTDQ
jgi:hypothetical protein